MRKMNASWRSAIGVQVILFSLLAQSCGWQKTMTFPSPSRRAAIEIWQTRLDNSWGTRVRLTTVERKAVVFENRREAHIYFVHVYWSPDESKVGVLGTGSKSWGVACDVRTGELIPFETIEEEFGESIRKMYHVPPKEDPVKWASSNDAHQAFFRLHPEIRLTYTQ